MNSCSADADAAFYGQRLSFGVADGSLRAFPTSETQTDAQCRETAHSSGLEQPGTPSFGSHNGNPCKRLRRATSVSERSPGESNVGGELVFDLKYAEA